MFSSDRAGAVFFDVDGTLVPDTGSSVDGGDLRGVLPTLSRLVATTR